MQPLCNNAGTLSDDAHCLPSPVSSPVNLSGQEVLSSNDIAVSTAIFAAAHRLELNAQ